MKKSTLSFMAAAALMTASSAGAKGLVPEQTSFSNLPLLYYPLEEFSASFDGGVAIAPGSVGTLYCQGEALMSVEIHTYNYEGKKRTQGWVIGDFPEPLLLDTGKSYSIVIPANTIWLEDDIDTYNDEIVMSFEVPSDLGQHQAVLSNGQAATDGDTVVSESSISFFWGTETEAAGAELSATLYRKDQAIGQYPFTVGWDWDLGQAHVDFGKELRFDCGVNYSLVIPSGAVRARGRADISNTRTTFSFVGGYTDPSGITSATSDTSDSAGVYTTTGLKIMCDATADDLRSLQAGVYIYKGRKLVK